MTGTTYTLQRLGQGSYGWVDLMVDLGTTITRENMFASKTCLYQNSETLMKEYKLLTLLPPSPYIVRCLGTRSSFDQHGNWLFHLMLEYAPNGTLADIIENKGALSENEVKTYTRMILQGLSCLHRNSIVHCDLKPANILAFFDNTLKIADLGLASSLSIPGSFLHPKSLFRGTSSYMSPESVRDGKISTALDVWSLGCIVSQMLTGQGPWDYMFEISGGFLLDQETMLEMITEELIHGFRTPLVPLQLSEQGKDFLKKCFCRDPAQRWTVEMLLHHPFLDDNSQQQQLNKFLLQDLNIPPPGFETRRSCFVQDLNFPPQEFENRTTKLTGLFQDLNISPLGSEDDTLKPTCFLPNLNMPPPLY